MTNWPNVEERLRGILDTFQECADFIPHEALRKQWIAGARNYVENVGERPDLIRPSIEYMQQRNLIIKSPGSLVTVALKLKRDEVPKVDRVPCPLCGAILGHARTCSESEWQV